MQGATGTSTCPYVSSSHVFLEEFEDVDHPTGRMKDSRWLSSTQPISQHEKVVILSPCSYMLQRMSRGWGFSKNSSF
jgi:hypothetical protein